MGGKDIGLRFGYPCVRWFTESSFENKDYFDKAESLTDIGVAKLLQFAYKNECVVNEVKPEIPFKDFYEWVEARVKMSGETAPELTDVIKVFLESQPVVEQKVVVEKKNQQEVKKPKTKKQTSTLLKELSTESSG